MCGHYSVLDRRLTCIGSITDNSAIPRDKAYRTYVNSFESVVLQMIHSSVLFFFAKVISLTHELEELQDRLGETEKLKKNQQVIKFLHFVLTG